MFIYRLPKKILFLLTRLQRFPWSTTAQVLLARFREDRLGLTAGSLTFTTITSLVPLATVALALFSVFPLFAQVELDLQRWMVQSLFPAIIAQNVSTYLAQFTSKAAQLGWASLVFLFFTAVALMLTVDNTLNKIWRVKSKRPLSQRILVYWGGITLGPLVLAASLSLSSYALAQSRSLEDLSLSFAHFLQFCIITAASTGMYRLVPNTAVRWGHAFAGGLFVALGVDIARRMLSIYFAAIPGVSTIYGAFATLPIFATLDLHPLADCALWRGHCRLSAQHTHGCGTREHPPELALAKRARNFATAGTSPGHASQRLEPGRVGAATARVQPTDRAHH